MKPIEEKIIKHIDKLGNLMSQEINGATRMERCLQRSRDASTPHFECDRRYGHNGPHMAWGITTFLIWWD